MVQNELLQAYEQMKEGLEAAEESTVPFPIVKDEKISVVGDANETQVEKHDYKITFMLPEGVVDGKKVPGGVLHDVEYKDVFISPRKRASVLTAICKLLPYFRKVADNGEAEEYSTEEAIALLAEWDDELIDCMYNLVARVLGVNEKLIDYMMPSSVISAVNRIIREFPDAVNEADVFFG